MLLFHDLHAEQKRIMDELKHHYEKYAEKNNLNKDEFVKSMLEYHAKKLNKKVKARKHGVTPKQYQKLYRKVFRAKKFPKVLVPESFETKVIVQEISPFRDIIQLIPNAI